MSERIVLYLNEDLDYLELNGMSAWVDGHRYELRTTSMPDRRRFVPGRNALVYS